MNLHRKNWNRELLIFILFFAMITIGTIDGFTGTALPLLKTEFSASNESQGFFNAGLSLGNVIACLTATFILHKAGVKNTLMTGFLVALIGLGSISLIPNFLVAGLIFMLMRMGLICYEMGINGLAAGVSDSPGRMINFTHFFYGVGAIFAPKLAGILISNSLASWRTVYLLGAFFIIVLIIATSFARIQTAKTSENKAKNQKGSLSKIIRNPAVWLFALILSFIGQTEFAASLWGIIYLQKMFHYDPVTAGTTFLSAFFLLFTAARLVSGMVIERSGYSRTIKFTLFCTVASLLLGFLLLENGVWLLALSGFFISIVWPSILAIMTRVFGENAPVAMSIATTISGTSSVFLQLFSGYSGQLFGSEWGYRTSLLYATVACVLFFLLSRYLNKKHLYRDEIN